MKYGLRSLQRDFPTDDACLDFIFDARHSRKCSCGGKYNRIKGRKQYQCSKCRFQIAPTAGTIFHKSDTPLTLWFHAILVFSNAKSGISAKYLQRELEVTYKCAYRILKRIREALKQDGDKLNGAVEIDTTMIGGKPDKKAKKNRSQMFAEKAIVVVAVERGGRMRAKVLPNSGGVTINDFVEQNVAQNATLITDGAYVFQKAGQTRDHQVVVHSKGEYVRGNAHINTIETFFAHLKRSIRGTYKSTSREQLQSYLDAFVFHYNNRHTDSDRFAALLGGVLRASK